MAIQGIMTLGIFVLTIILLVWKPVHPIVVGASIPILLSVLKILPANQAFQDFGNTTVVFFMSLLVVGAAIFKTGLADFIGEKLVNIIGKGERQIIVGSSFVVTALSAFLNDTGTTGCMLPIVASMAKKSKVALSKVVMTLAFFSCIGGTITLAGTTPNIVASGLLEKAGYQAFGFFEFAKLGLPIAIVCLLYVFLYGYKLMPYREITDYKIPESSGRSTLKMILVSLIFVMILVCMATNLLPMHVAAALGALLVVLTGCINYKEAVNSFSVSTLFLIAGIFPLSTAMIKTGAAAYIVKFLAIYLNGMSPLLAYSMIALVTIVLTNFLMNTSLTAILVPIGILIAEATNMDPRGVTAVIAIAASAGFCTPFGNGVNIIVWEVGGYDLKDYLKGGLGLSIIFWIMLSGLGYYFYG
jgi:sodium-dependent dicarboxylate transporter 2/3/5